MKWKHVLCLFVMMAFVSSQYYYIFFRFCWANACTIDRHTLHALHCSGSSFLSVVQCILCSFFVFRVSTMTKFAHKCIQNRAPFFFFVRAELAIVIFCAAVIKLFSIFSIWPMPHYAFTLLHFRCQLNIYFWDEMPNEKYPSMRWQCKPECFIHHTAPSNIFIFQYARSEWDKIKFEKKNTVPSIKRSEFRFRFVENTRSRLLLFIIIELTLSMQGCRKCNSYNEYPNTK